MAFVVFSDVLGANVRRLFSYSGGTTVTVTGENVSAAAQPFITVTVVVTRFNSTDRVDASNTSHVTATSEVFQITLSVHSSS